MYRLSMVALAGLVLVAAALLAATAAAGGVPPFGVFMTLCFLAFCCNGVLFGNLNALAMQSLGRVAGLGASMVSSLRSEEHTYELQSLMRISYAVFCLKKKKTVS